MKTSRAKRASKLRSSTSLPRPPANLSPFAQRLDAAFRDIFAGKVTVREVEIPDPGGYGPREVRATRQRLGVSIEVFARLLGVSAKLVEHWEQGRRTPSPLAARLLDRINAEPDQFLSDLLRARKVAG